MPHIIILSPSKINDTSPIYMYNIGLVLLVYLGCTGIIIVAVVEEALKNDDKRQANGDDSLLGLMYMYICNYILLVNIYR